jgi:hypothetical protein
MNWKSLLYRRPYARRRLSPKPYRPSLEEIEPRVLLSTNVLTWHNDNARDGLNPNETILTPANVSPTTFGKLFTYPVDGYVYAQPLYMANVPIAGQGIHNVVFVATEHDSVYAFDADGLNPTPLWHTSFIDPMHGITTVASGDVNTGDIVPEIGITGTPVINPNNNMLYVVAKTKEMVNGNATFVQRLHVLDITTGLESPLGPVVISAQVPGTGDGSAGGMVAFNPLTENQRSALLLSRNIVYIAWASHGDNGPYHGWVMGYNATTLLQVSVFNTTPNGGLGGVWMSGAGPAADANGNIYFATGNGSFDGQNSGSDFGDSILKLSTKRGLNLADYFTPFNQNNLNAGDVDLGSGGVMLLPDQTGTHPHLLVLEGKEGKIYLVDRDNMGKFNAGTDNVVQVVPGVVNGTWSTPAYFNGEVYYNGIDDALKALSVSVGLLGTTPLSQATVGFGYPGATPSISSNARANGIVWTLQTDAYGSNGPAVLHAYDATDVSHELYNSSLSATDQLGGAVKFSVPTVANGRVFVGTSNSLSIFGHFTDLTGRVFDDIKGDGQINPADPGDPGIPGVTVFLDLNHDNQIDPGDPTATTDSNGNYLFAGVPVNTYQVREVRPPGYIQTSLDPAPVTLQFGENVQGGDFANFLPFTLTGTVFQDTNGNGQRDAGEPSLAGWTVFLDSNQLFTPEQSTVTDSNGAYQFASQGPGTYTVRVQLPPGWQASTDNPMTIHGQSDTPAMANFGAFQPATLSGRVFEDRIGQGNETPSAPGVANWTVFVDLNHTGQLQANDPRTTTGPDGSYQISNLPPGTYDVRDVVPFGWMPTTAAPSGLLVQSGGGVRADFGNFHTISISGRVFDDQDSTGNDHGGAAPGLNTYTVNLYLDRDQNGQLDSADVLLSTQATPGNTGIVGGFSFNGLGPGMYLLTQEPQPGHVQTSPVSGLYSVTAISGQPVTGVTFGDLNTPNRNYVFALYEQLLGRRVDPDGLATWSGMLDHGTSRVQVVQAIQGSDEYLTKKVEEVYHKLLHRDADANGLQSSLNLLRGIPAIPGVTDLLGQLEANIMGSVEYFQLHGGTNTGFLTGIYQDVYGRAVDPTGAITFGTLLVQGVSRTLVAKDVLFSTEADGLLASGYYQTLLKRSADPNGLNSWITALHNGASQETVLLGFLASDEYYQKV